jgi:hypothetical protein
MAVVLRMVVRCRLVVVRFPKVLRDCCRVTRTVKAVRIAEQFSG